MPEDRPDEARPDGAHLVTHLGDLARELQAAPDMATLLRHIVGATVDELDGAEHGGISLITDRAVRSEAATSELVERLDQHQHRLGEGPCLSSLREEVTVRVDDLRNETRWPRFVAAAIDERVRSILAVQLYVEGDNLGALNLYATTPGAFHRYDESTAMALAAHAAVAVKGAQVESNLRTALGSRDVIGQAKGILMERFRIGPDEAFSLLALASQRTHRKLREIAEELAATGELRVD